MEFSKPKVTIDLEEYNSLLNSNKENNIKDASNEALSIVMSLLNHNKNTALKPLDNYDVIKILQDAGIKLETSNDKFQCFISHNHCEFNIIKASYRK